MQTFWDSGLPLVGTMLVMVLGAFILWTSCLIRVGMVLFPSYGINGIKTIYFTHPNVEGNYGTLLSAYGLENTAGICMIPMCAMFTFQIFRTCEVEKNYVLKDRPKTIAQFCVQALKHLDDDDFSTKAKSTTFDGNDKNESQKESKMRRRNTVKLRQHASEKVALMFQKLGYCVGRVIEEELEDEDLGLSLGNAFETSAMVSYFYLNVFYFSSVFLFSTEFLYYSIYFIYSIL